VDFFFFSKIIPPFIYPLGLITISLIYIYFTSERKTKSKLIFPLLLLFLFTTTPVPQCMLKELEKEYRPLTIDEVNSAQAIVILGGMTNPSIDSGTHPSFNSAFERLYMGLELWKAKKAPLVVFTSGSGFLGGQEFQESPMAIQYLQSQGIPSQNILVESQSRNTSENAKYTYELLKSKNIDKIILITSAFHMRRAMKEFKKYPLVVYPFATDHNSLREDFLGWDRFVPSPHNLSNSTMVLKEYLGLIVQWVRNPQE
jgi:uncharacterized SAM-binding protein YcdF (DUF218 family)